MMRLVCSLIGHRWAPPIPQPGYWYLTYCLRCDTGLRGDWEQVEAAGAWEHWRW